MAGDPRLVFHTALCTLGTAQTHRLLAQLKPAALILHGGGQGLPSSSLHVGVFLANGVQGGFYPQAPPWL